ncbi:hypothetical protein Vadar_033085 [Vaccinium darrowii]|uniref:Uncharacterized protein n=1 Tax=Vaccinium darrowii TaxID=229202 RepID=A0ACB7YRU6_9ERIC|nr:hypothetical protein Vadar_033085 [Vaccinium darrowii]
MTVASDLFEPTHTKALVKGMEKKGESAEGDTDYSDAIASQPGDSKSVTLVRIGGMQVIRGGNGIADGPVDDANITSLMEAVHSFIY